MEMLEITVVLTVFSHLVACPYTKVEESFNIQAIHDIIHHGTNINKYDHLEFPGVVPRTFLGPLIISYLSFPVVAISRLFSLNKFILQIIVRACLGLVTSACLLTFCNSLKALLGNSVRRYFYIVTCSQFHLLFYASRPLANIFALTIVLLALSCWLRRNYPGFLWLSGAVIIVFRFDAILLLLPITVMELFTRRLPFVTLLRHCVPASLLFLGLTLLVDSFFWREWLWPEGTVIWYNTVLNKSSNWGTEPFLWYFYSALPRCIGPAIILVPVGVYLDRRLLTLILPSLLFVFLFSFLPHKELRFIIYAIPLLNVAIATALSRFVNNRLKSRFQTLQACAAIILIVGNIAMTTFLLYISHHNYPGGQAMAKLHQLESRDQDVNVHIDVYSAQTGITRFTQIHDHWRLYNKSEHLTVKDINNSLFTHILVGGTPESYAVYARRYKLVAEINAFRSVKFNLRNFPPITLEIEPSVWILKRRNE